MCGTREEIVWVYLHGQTMPEQHFNQWAQLDYSINGSGLEKNKAKVQEWLKEQGRFNQDKRRL